MTYLSYWSLRRKPFNFAQGDDFFAGVPQREALAGLSYFVGSDEKLAMLVCPDQNGLSWLLAHAIQMRGFGDQATELISTTGCHPDRQQLVTDLCIEMGFEKLTPQVEQQFDAAIESLRKQDVSLVWMLDRCHPEVAELAQAIAGLHENLSAVICTTEQSVRPTVLRLGRCPMQIDLSPLSVDDTCDYVRYCLERAAGDPKIMSDNTSVRLHEITGGHLGKLSLAAESSLALAANHRFDTVTPAIVEAFAEGRRRAA